MQPTSPQTGGTEEPQQPEPQDLYRPAQAPAPAPAPAPTPPPAPSPTYAPQPQQPQQPAQPAPAVTDTVSWEASEYLHRSKDAMWIIGFLIITLVFIGVAVWLQAWTFVALVVVMAAAMGFFAFRAPRTLHYTLSPQGLQIGDKYYAYSDFKAFGVRDEEAFYSIMLIPVKRFMPAITIYFAESEGEKIVDILGAWLPMEKFEPDFVDNLMRRLHF